MSDELRDDLQFHDPAGKKLKARKFKRINDPRKRFKPSTMQDRIDFLRLSIGAVIKSHGAPCMCVLCEALIFDSLALEGKVNLKTGERNDIR